MAQDGVELEPHARADALHAIDAALQAVTTNTSGATSGQTSERAPADEGRIGFLSTVCHDLKDPLAAVVMGSSFLMRETKNAPESDRVPRMVHAIHRAGTRMSSLLQNLTDFVHLTTGRRVFDMREHPLRPLVERVVTRTLPSAEPNKVTLQIDVPDDLRVLCDGDAVTLALEHLLSNALRYTPASGTIVIRTTPVPGDAKRVRLRVQDSGPGVLAERLPHLFDTYWHARQKARDGVGLGLGIVDAVAQAHGGAPGVENASSGASVGFDLARV